MSEDFAEETRLLFDDRQNETLLQFFMGSVDRPGSPISWVQDLSEIPVMMEGALAGWRISDLGLLNVVTRGFGTTG